MSIQIHVIMSQDSIHRKFIQQWWGLKSNNPNEPFYSASLLSNIIIQVKAFRYGIITCFRKLYNKLCMIKSCKPAAGVFIFHKSFLLVNELEL